MGEQTSSRQFFSNQQEADEVGAENCLSGEGGCSEIMEPFLT